MVVEVQIRYDCPHCKGVGIVQNPVWAEFWEQPNAKSMTNEETEQWFEDRGLMVWSASVMGSRCRLFPDEEIPCWECEGSKKLLRWVPIDSILPGQHTTDGMGVLAH